MLSFVNSHSNFNYYIVTIHILALDSQCRRNSSSRIRFRRQSSSLETCNMLIIIYNYIKYSSSPFASLVKVASVIIRLDS